MNNKPVAWRKVVGNVTKHYQYNEMGEGTPLYLHPAKTLTDEEIDNAITEAFNRGARFGYAEGLKKASEK